MAQPQLRFQREVIDAREFVEKRSCAKCAHFNTCGLWRAMGRDLESMYGRGGEEKSNPIEAPIKLEDLAQICKQYLNGVIPQ